MKVQIIYCHPSRKSYTYQILEALKTNLEKENITYEVSDLYEMNFTTDMSAAEYEREGLVDFSLSIPPDIQEEHRKIEAADCIIFLYPVWWSDCPSKLKGWFDRVYAVGYAYGHKPDSNIKKMKTIPYGLALCTAGHPNEFLTKIGISESMRNVMIDDRLGSRFANKEMIILGGTLDKAKARPIHAEIIATIGGKIKKHCQS